MSTGERLAKLEEQMKDARTDLERHDSRIATIEHDKSRFIGIVAAMVFSGGVFVALANRVVVTEVQEMERRVTETVKKAVRQIP